MTKNRDDDMWRGTSVYIDIIINSMFIYKKSILSNIIFIKNATI